MLRCEVGAITPDGCCGVTHYATFQCSEWGQDAPPHPHSMGRNSGLECDLPGTLGPLCTHRAPNRAQLQTRPWCENSVFVRFS